MQPEKVSELSWGATLRLERVAKGHRVVVTMPESFSDLAQARSVLFKQGGVSVAEYVPADAGLLQRAEGLIKYATSLGVGHGDRELQFFEDELRVLIERDQAFATACLRAVYGASSVPGSPDVQKIIDHVAWLNRHGLTDAQPGQEAQPREETPLLGHTADDLDELPDRDVVPALPGHGDTRPRRWNW